MIRARRRLLAAIAAAAFVPAAALAQAAGGVIVVDKDRVLRESAVAERLAAAERVARAELQADMGALNDRIEAEEAELTRLRETLAKSDFDARVREFNSRVQDARRDFQMRNEEIQREFVAARQRVSAALNPVLQRILQDNNGAIVIDARGVLMASAAIDKTADALTLFDEATAELFPATPGATDE